MKKFLLILLSCVISISLILCMLLSSILMFVFNTETYEKEFAKFNTAERLAMSDDDLSKVTKVLVDYMKGDREDLVVKVSVDGQYREFFNAKEKSHMVDVKNLCLLTRNVLICVAFLLVLFVVVFLVVMLTNRKKSEKTFGYKIEKQFLILSRTYLISSLCFLGVIANIGIWAGLDFNSFWRNFHMIFFTNDLWILDSRVDLLMAMMKPMKFFSDIIFKIVFTFVSLFATSIIGSIIINKIFKRRLVKK